MKFGSLFSGIGGFEVGFERSGMECAWQVEIDKRARSVLRRQWEDTPKHKDVKDVGKANLQPVDLVCGGFPCTDLSVAGNRKGLAGEQSGLYFEFHRVVTELGPKWVVVENVPGLLNSNEGRDFAIVVGGLTGIVPNVPKQGWGNAGAFRGPERSVAYRVLDSQFFGVAQQRRRVYIVASAGDGSCASVLFEPKSGARNAPAHQESKRSNSTAIAYSPFNHYVYDRSDLAATIHNYRQLSGSEHLIVDSRGVRRLTPVEVERLQGFDDGWTSGQPDAVRYRQLGNAVTVNVAEWIGKRIIEAENE